MSFNPVPRVTINFLGFPQGTTINNASTTATPSRSVIVELPANSTESTISRFGHKAPESITTIEDLLKHVKKDPSLIEDTFINIYKCAVYTSDFVTLSLSAPIGILRDGEKLIVTYHGGADKDIVVQEKQTGNGKNPTGISAFPGSLPKNSMEIAHPSKYDRNAFDDDIFGDGIKTGKAIAEGNYDDDDDSYTKATLAKSKVGKAKSPQKITIDSNEIDFVKPSAKKTAEISKIGSTKGHGGMDYIKKIPSTSSISSMGSLDDEVDSPGLAAHGNSHRSKPKLSNYGNFDEDTYNESSKPAKSSSINADRSRSKEHSSSRSDSKKASSPSTKSRTAPSIPAPIPHGVRSSHAH